MSVTLTLRTLWSGTAAGNGTAVPLDYRAAQNAIRTVMINSMNATDTIAIQGSMDGTVWVNITTHTGDVGPFAYAVTNPFTYLRIAKTGSAGAAVVMGIV